MRCHTISQSTGNPCNARARQSGDGVSWWQTFFCRIHAPGTLSEALEQLGQWLVGSPADNMTEEVANFLDGTYRQAPETAGQVLEAIGQWLQSHSPRRLPSSVLYLMRQIHAADAATAGQILGMLEPWLAQQGPRAIDGGLADFLPRLAGKDRWSALRVALLGTQMAGNVLRRSWALILAALSAVGGLAFFVGYWSQLKVQPIVAALAATVWFGLSIVFLTKHYWDRLTRWYRRQPISAELETRWAETAPFRQWVRRNRIWIGIALFVTFAAEMAEVIAIWERNWPLWAVVFPLVPWIGFTIWRASRIPNWSPRLARHWVGLTCLGIIIAWAGLILAWHRGWIGGTELGLTVLQSVGLCFWPAIPLVGARILWKRNWRLTPYVQRVWDQTEQPRVWIRGNWRVLTLALATVAAEGVMYGLGWPKWRMFIPVIAWLVWAIWRYRRAQDLRARFHAWRQAHRSAIGRIGLIWLGLPAFLYLIMVRLDQRVAFLKEPRYVALILGWPLVLLALSVGPFRRLVVLPLGLTRRSQDQGARPRPDLWPQVATTTGGRNDAIPWPPRGWLGLLLEWWGFNLAIPYWLAVVVAGVWLLGKLPAQWPLWPNILAMTGLIWAAYFVWSSLRVGPYGGCPLPTGHTIAVEDRPHLSGFVRILFRWGLFGPMKWPGLEGWTSIPGLALWLLYTALRLFLGGGPLLVIAVTAAAYGLNQTWKLWTHAGFPLVLGASLAYWVVFAACGWRRIHYLGTFADGRKAMTRLVVPRLTPLGVRSDPLGCATSALKSVDIDPVDFAPAFVRDVDPGVVVGREHGNIIFLSCPKGADWEAYFFG